MTMVAGFRTGDGILLCSDTMYSTGYSKIHQPKIFTRTAGGILAAFALAGNEAYGKMAIEDCEEAIDACPRKERDLRRIRAVLRKVIKAVNEEYVDKRPETEREVAKFDLLIGLWLASDRQTHLFSTSGPALMRVDNHQCLGSGAFIGSYFLRNVVTRSMQMRRAIILAIQTLAAAKNYDPNCGGTSAFVAIGKDGSMSKLHEVNVQHSELFLREFEVLTARLMIDLGDIDLEETAFQKSLTDFCEQLKLIKHSWKLNAEASRLVVGISDAMRDIPDSAEKGDDLPNRPDVIGDT